MAKLTLTDITSGYQSPSTINDNNAAIEAALENTLSRDGTSPNTMSAPLDMNSQAINNLPDAVSNQQPITLSQAASLASVDVSLSRENVGAVLYPRTTDEISAAITPTYFYYPEGNVLRYGAVGDDSTDSTTAIQNAIDVMEQKGGGDVVVPAGTYIVSDTLTVNGPVWLRGEGAAFEQVFTASVSYSGSVIKLDDAAFTVSTDAIIEFDYTGAGGEARLHGGASNILVFGNRGSNADPTHANAKDNNTYGIGFLIKGARYVTLDHCFAIWCAEDGVQVITDGVSSNNVRILGGAYLSNSDDGIDWAGGDSYITDVQCGYNAGDGIACAGGVHLNNVRCWDNFTHGLRITSHDVNVTGGTFYDNQDAGILLSGAVERITIAGTTCQDNGKDTGESDSVRSGIYVSGACIACSIAGLSTGNKDENGTTGQKYGLRIINTSADIAYAGVSGNGNGTALLSDLRTAVSLGAITDSSGGTAADTIVAISGSGDDTDINNNFASLARKVTALQTALGLTEA